MSFKKVIELAKKFEKRAMSAKDENDLSLKLQDAYHYFDSVKGGGNFSARSLLDKLNLYKEGKITILEAVDLDEFPENIHNSILNELPNINEIETENELFNYAKLGRHLVVEMAKLHNIDPYTGKLKG